MNLSTIVKLAKGGLNPDQLVELLRGMGWQVNFQELMPGQRRMAFQRTAGAAVEEESHAMAFSGINTKGDRIEALLVVVPAERLKKTA